MENEKFDDDSFWKCVDCFKENRKIDQICRNCKKPHHLHEKLKNCVNCRKELKIVTCPTCNKVAPFNQTCFYCKSLLESVSVCLSCSTTIIEKTLD